MHLTDEQLNEYLDHETDDWAQIETHLAACEACSARLAALRDLFTEIESLTALELSPNFSVDLRSSQPVPLPRSLTLTVTLQAVFAFIGIVIAAPFVVRFTSFSISSLSLPSLLDVFLQLQSQWRAWLDALSTFSLPPIPEIPLMDVSSLFAVVVVIGVSLLWLVGNGLLLRNRTK
jgi:hypothetical protein